jgi:nucleoside-diphosphate-sugar epimerase
VKYLITGVAGFIGSNIAHKLVRMGHDVVGIDNLFAGRLENLRGVEDTIEFHCADVRDLDVCRDLCTGVDYVLHQAAIGSVPRSVVNPTASNDNNVNGTLNMLVAARDARVKRFVYAASSSAYGDTEHQPKVETMLTRAVNPYGVTKLVGEMYAEVFTKVYDLSTVRLRYFNVFGPRQNPNAEYAAVIPKFIDCALDRVPAVIYGDGEQTRDFTFVGDVVWANLRACEVPGIDGDVFNIGGNGRISLNELHRTVADLTGSYVDPAYLPDRKGDIRDSYANVNKARRVLGFEPYAETSFRQRLLETIAWFVKDRS